MFDCDLIEINPMYWVYFFIKFLLIKKFHKQSKSQTDLNYTLNNVNYEYVNLKTHLSFALIL